MPRSIVRALGIALPARNVALARGLAVLLSWLLARLPKGGRKLSLQGYCFVPHHWLNVLNLRFNYFFSMEERNRPTKSKNMMKPTDWLPKLWMFLLSTSGNEVWKLDEKSWLWQINELSEAFGSFTCVAYCSINVKNNRWYFQRRNGNIFAMRIYTILHVFIENRFLCKSTRHWLVNSQTSSPVVWYKQSHLSGRRHMMEIPTSLTISQILTKLRRQQRNVLRCLHKWLWLSGNIVALSQSQRNCLDACVLFVSSLFSSS